MSGSTREKSRRRLLQLLLSRGLVMAAEDHRVLRDLERRRHVQAQPLHNPRGQLFASRAWSITTKGRAWLQEQPARTKPRQIDIEDAIAASSLGDRPESVPLPVPDAPATPIASVSAPHGRPIEKPSRKAGGARGRTPEPAHV